MSPVVPRFLILSALVSVSLNAGQVGGYWAFQGGASSAAAETYSDLVSEDIFPGTPIFARSGDQLSTFGGMGDTFVNFSGSEWD